jgi:hypothetical protein
MPQTDAALVVIAHPTVDVSSMAGLLAQFITNAPLGLDPVARAQLVWPGDSGPASTKSQRTGRQADAWDVANDALCPTIRRHVRRARRRSAQASSARPSSRPGLPACQCARSTSAGEQREDVDSGIAQAWKLSVACGESDHQNGGTNLFARPERAANYSSKKDAGGGQKLGTGMQARICL